VNIEGKLARLEEIVKSLEGEDVSLEQSLRLFEEGIKLANEVKQQLNESKLKIKEIIAKGEGLFDWKELEF